MEERRSPKPKVAGSTPATPANPKCFGTGEHNAPTCDCREIYLRICTEAERKKYSL